MQSIHPVAFAHGWIAGDRPQTYFSFILSRTLKIPFYQILGLMSVLPDEPSLVLSYVNLPLELLE